MRTLVSIFQFFCNHNGVVSSCQVDHWNCSVPSNLQFQESYQSKSQFWESIWSVWKNKMRIKVLESTNSLIIFSKEHGINKHIQRVCDFFDYHNEDFNLWQNFLLLVWSIAICSIKVAQQILVATWLAHSFNHPSSIPPTMIATKPIQVTLHHSKLPI